MIKIDHDLKPADLKPELDQLWALSAQKILAIDQSHQPGDATPVFTVQGKYTARGG